MGNLNRRREYNQIHAAKYTPDSTDIDTLSNNVYREVWRLEFVFALSSARDANSIVRAETPHPSDLPDVADGSVAYYLHANGKSGFAHDYNTETVFAEFDLDKTLKTAR